MPRLEYKYFMPLSQLNDLRRDVTPYLNYDFFAEKMQTKEYTVRSIYLDSQQLLTYHEKSDGVKRRHKYRIRGYNLPEENSLVFLEIKGKNIDYISKDRIPVLYKNLEAFLETKDLSLIHSVDDALSSIVPGAESFFYYYLLYDLRPKVIVTYEREAYECKFGSGLRITFDKNIRTRETDNYTDLFQEQDMIPSVRDYFVLEVKFHKVVPRWVPIIIRKYNLIRGSAPKYSMSIDAAVLQNNFSQLI